MNKHLEQLIESGKLPDWSRFSWQRDGCECGHSFGTHRRDYNGRTPPGSCNVHGCGCAAWKHDPHWISEGKALTPREALFTLNAAGADYLNDVTRIGIARELQCTAVAATRIASAVNNARPFVAGQTLAKLKASPNFGRASWLLIYRSLRDRHLLRAPPAVCPTCGRGGDET